MKDDILQIFSKRLKELRLEAGYTQTALAELLHMKQQSYIRYEYGLGEPNLQTLARLSDIFGVSVDYLLGRSDL